MKIEFNKYELFTNYTVKIIKNCLSTVSLCNFFHTHGPPAEPPIPDYTYNSPSRTPSIITAPPFRTLPDFRWVWRGSIPVCIFGRALKISFTLIFSILEKIFWGCKCLIFYSFDLFVNLSYLNFEQISCF